MKYLVLCASIDHIEIWDGKTKDEWGKPGSYTLFGDFSEFSSGDKVEIFVRMLEKARAEAPALSE